MKVYFSSSLRAKKFYQEHFEQIYQTIKDLGYQHTSDFLIKADPNEYYKHQKGKQFAKLYKILISQIKKADICIFEVSLHSLGIGYCINLALDMGKPVIALCLQGKEPIFFQNMQNERFILSEYNRKNLKKVLKNSLDIAKELIDIRFTFFITSKINNFLSWISKNKKIPRAVYLRQLVEKEMKKYRFEEE